MKKSKNYLYKQQGGKAKFLKHICALSNTNPENNSDIIIGVEDQENKNYWSRFF